MAKMPELPSRSPRRRPSTPPVRVEVLPGDNIQAIDDCVEILHEILHQSFTRKAGISPLRRE
ncbi:MAG: hypothetical protein M0Z53_16545 [Thermaerobacter sp.]|nr:hypothetical protein [Thermaerobacter sp.]